jgi:hypothetical protein
MDWSHTLSRKKREQKQKERNVSLGYLMRIYEEHQLESLGDIALIYNKIARSLGYRTMRYQEYLNTTGMDSGADALYHMDELHKWRKQCEKWNLDPDGTELLARDGAPIERIVRELRLPRDRIILHSQCCLTVWSVNSHRCSSQELHNLMRTMDPEFVGGKAP